VELNTLRTAALPMATSDGRYVGSRQFANALMDGNSK